MLMNIINSGSDGNCVILKDIKGNELILDCGLTYELITKYCNFENLDTILITHFHKDHSKSFDKFEKFGFDVYSPKNIKDGQIIDLSNWKIMPMKLIHNIECFGFLIYSKIENKKMAYITDTNYIPKLGKIDLLCIDTNYSKKIVEEKLKSNQQINMGHKNHLSNEQVAEYVKNLGYKLPYLIAYHISNSSLNSLFEIKDKLDGLANNLIISKPNTLIEF